MHGPFETIANENRLSASGLTLVNGRTFSVADGTGSLTAPWHGSVHEDIRFLSSLRFTVVEDGVTLGARPLRTTLSNPFSSVSVLQLERPDAPVVTADAVVIHSQWVGRGCRHRFELRNLARSPVTWSLSVSFDTDFAHLFDMKGGARHGPSALLTREGTAIVMRSPDSDIDVATRVFADPDPDPSEAEIGTMTWTIGCAPRESRSVTLTFEPVWEGQPAGLVFGLGQEVVIRPTLGGVAGLGPSIETTDRRLSEAFERSLTDLASLRIFDPSNPQNVVVAAGAPWFMTLFGRDSILTAYMTLPFAPELATGVLAALGTLQGTKVNPLTEEEPGKIIHELRRPGGDAAFTDRGRYYGTVDATPLYVMLAGEALRWGHLDDELFDELWPSVVAAANWTRAAVESGPLGFVSYHRSTEHGLANQGWKDSWDGVTYADGRLPSGPIALAEVQGYAYAALLAAAEMAERVDDGELEVDQLRRLAAELRERFNEQFWMDDAGSFALALTDDGTKVDSLTTNPGHAVWCGIAEDDLAARYLERCMEADVFNGWGLRTLGRGCQAYNPLSYHNGSVWPHDTALVAAGAVRIGRRDLAARLADGALDAAAFFEGRPPELFAGFDRTDVPAPVTYPSSCSPQAWSSASILLHLWSLAGLRPEGGSVTAQDLDSVGITRLSGLRFGSSVVELHA